MEKVRVPLWFIVATFVLGGAIAGLLDTYEIKRKYCPNVPYFNRQWPAGEFKCR